MGTEKRRRRRWIGWLAGTLVVLAGGCFFVYGGGRHEAPGEPIGRSLPAAMVGARAARQRGPAEGEAGQILFGDLHVHTTFSGDAFLMSLPLLGGEGTHPPADACDFARYCSDLDFFALTDHAEALTPEHWRESLALLRQCDAVANDPRDPDLVVFAGFEWSQVGPTPELHYGHKNVIFHELDPATLPARPIASRGIAAAALTNVLDPWVIPMIPIWEFGHRQRYLDLAVFFRENASLDECPSGIDSTELPEDCREFADTPRDLFEKLDQWGSDALVIPHGTTWGFYTPPGYTWDKQIGGAQDDPDRQRLIEVYSGHGSSEEHRPWRAIAQGPEGPECPDPSEGYEPCCWRAGEIIRARCDDPESDACEQRVIAARRDYVAAGIGGHLTVPGATVEDWGDCGQCTDCFDPSFSLRPGGSVQYILARGRFGEGAPRHQTLGFVASSDNHSARPGTGYKEIERMRFTEATGPESEAWRDRIWGERPAPVDHSVPMTPEQLLSMPPFLVVEMERQASFFLTGGLVAVHAEGRSRDAIWEALRERRVYGTSGDRILLWFDLIGGAGRTMPMGSDVRVGHEPRFRVRAAGAFEQRPGCPEWTEEHVSPEALERLCAGECYNPGDRRKRITRIEIVRIRPQIRDDEPIESLIDDPWRTLPCPEGEDVCVVETEDAELVSSGRDALYYARAIEEPSPAVNADNLRCDENGCNPCYGDYRTPADDDCLAPNEERAWSSPIWVRFDASLATPAEEESE